MKDGGEGGGEGEGSRWGEHGGGERTEGAVEGWEEGEGCLWSLHAMTKLQPTPCLPELCLWRAPLLVGGEVHLPCLPARSWWLEGVGQVRGGVKEAHFKRSVELRTYRSK